jgi:hypothetical protein
MNKRTLSLRKRLLSKIDKLSGYEEKYTILNKYYLTAENLEQENMILGLISNLMYFGR